MYRTHRAIWHSVKEAIGTLSIIGLVIGGIFPHWIQAAVNNVLLSVPIISAGTVTITSPSSFIFAPIAAALTTGVATQDFTGGANYFIVTDLKGSDSGYSTTLQMASDLITGGNSISSGNIAFKADYAEVIVLSGASNPRVITDSAATGSFQSLNIARTFIYRNNALNSGALGQYGQHVTMQVTVPAGQPAGAYSGWLIYTLIEN